MDKKLYYRFSDNGDYSEIIMSLSGIMGWIEADMHGRSEKDAEDIQYTITPVWMTEEEFENLPEAEI